MATYTQYATLVERSSAWTFNDLGDLLHEIEADPELGRDERADLKAQMFERLWERAKLALTPERARR